MGREDATGVQFGCDGADSGDPLGAHLVHDSPQIGCPPVSVSLHLFHDLLIADLLTSERPCSVGIAELDATSLNGG
jgi:hypothetical protein